MNASTTVALIGAGKMGLPLACQLAAGGARVIACDLNRAVVDAINQGRMLFEEPGVDALLQQMHQAGRISATTDLSDGMRQADVVIVLIPVLLSREKNADLGGMEAVTRKMAAGLRPGMMVSYETTLPVGTTRNLLRPILETSGLRAGVDFDLIFSPERVKSRHVLEHLTKVPKIVGGVSARSAARGAEFYGRYLGAPTLNVETLEAAELAKLAGMVYRDVNIALANELANYAESVGVDFAAVRAAANTDGESFLLLPGIGVGGHCTPVYPYFVLRDAVARHIPVTLAEAGRTINDGQAARALDRAAALGARLDGNDVLILGLGFRPKVKEHTLSSAFLIAEAARTRGARVWLHDPLYSAAEIAGLGFEAWDWNSTTLPAVIVLNTAHPEYLNPPFASWYQRGARYLVDGRNTWDPDAAAAAGLFYVASGVADRSPTLATIEHP
jgi:nucleotide sugar dehydrogenase